MPDTETEPLKVGLCDTDTAGAGHIDEAGTELRADRSGPAGKHASEPVAQPADQPAKQACAAAFFAPEKHEPHAHPHEVGGDIAENALNGLAHVGKKIRGAFGALGDAHEQVGKSVRRLAQRWSPLFGQVTAIS